MTIVTSEIESRRRRGRLNAGVLACSLPSRLPPGPGCRALEVSGRAPAGASAGALRLGRARAPRRSVPSPIFFGFALLRSPSENPRSSVPCDGYRGALLFLSTTLTGLSRVRRAGLHCPFEQAIVGTASPQRHASRYAAERSAVAIDCSSPIAAWSCRVRAIVMSFPGGSPAVGMGVPNVTRIRGRCIKCATRMFSGP